VKIEIRPPRDAEWRICRMLLPETFAYAASRSYLLALREEAPRVVGAASFRSAPDSVGHLRLHVVPGFRRRGVGSQLLAQAAAGGPRTVWGTAEILSEPAAEQFCECNGLERVESLTTVEAEIAGMREYLGRLRARLSLPPGARVVPLVHAPLEQVAALHARLVAHEGELSPWRARVANTPGMERSIVAMLEDRVVGILLWDLEADTAVVRSRAVSPEHRSGWVNVMLQAEALDAGWAAGVRRVRFFYTDSNRDTRKLAARFQAEVVTVVARFVRPA
jgi:GNAT superfamily N-acetyltransferase